MILLGKFVLKFFTNNNNETYVVYYYYDELEKNQSVIAWT